MNRTFKIYIVIFAAAIALMMYLEYTAPKPVDWSSTYSAKDKIPFGTYVLANELPKLFPEKKIQFIENQTIANFLSENKNIGTDNVYFLIEPNNLSKPDQNALFSFVEKGNDVFLVSNYLQKMLTDSLRCKDVPTSFVQKKDFENVKLFLTNPAFGNKNFKFKKTAEYSFFSKIDTASTVILGEYRTANNERRTNFIKQKFGKGNFYIHLFPEAFGNYYLLKDSTYSYSIDCINYLTKKNIFWDEYKKSVNTPPESLLKFVYAHPPLHWAWTLLLGGALFYCLFFSKRLQRIIPIMEPLKNTTAEFTKTIGNLYYNSREHGDLVQKKIKYFLYFVKEKYHLEIEDVNDEFSEKLRQKSGVSKEIINKIVLLIRKNRNAQTSTEEALKEINSEIDKFYRAKEF